MIFSCFLTQKEFQGCFKEKHEQIQQFKLFFPKRVIRKPLRDLITAAVDLSPGRFSWRSPLSVKARACNVR